MEEVTLLEFEDLGEELQERVKTQYIEDIVDIKLGHLNIRYSEGELSEKEYYEKLGADKEYAETVPWFTGSIYYENHQTEVDEEAEDDLHNDSLFTESGGLIRRDDIWM